LPTGCHEHLPPLPPSSIAEAAILAGGFPIVPPDAQRLVVRRIPEEAAVAAMRTHVVGDPSAPQCAGIRTRRAPWIPPKAIARVPSPGDGVAALVDAAAAASVDGD